MMKKLNCDLNNEFGNNGKLGIRLTHIDHI